MGTRASSISPRRTEAAFDRDGAASVLTLVEGGDAALDQAYEAVKRAPASAILARADVRLRAPIQPPPQMRDCLCFELHLKQAFAASRKLAAMQGPDPEKAIAEIERSGAAGRASDILQAADLLQGESLRGDRDR